MPSLMSPEEISLAQARLRPLSTVPRTRNDYRKMSRWWELEARRGYTSSAKSLEYSNNMRWAAELAGLTGPGTWLELIQRSAGATTRHARWSEWLA